MNLLRRQIVPYLVIFFTTALLILLGATTTEARKRPTVGGPDACPTYDCEGGIICSCCFDDGCWICDANPQYSGIELPIWNTCEWEPAFRKTRKGFTIIPPGGGVLDPGPPVTNTRPYSVPRGGGVLSP